MTRPKLNRLLTMLAVLALASAALIQAQTYTVLRNFNDTDGCCANYPSMLAQGKDGNIYGATTSGGKHFYGNIFKMTPTGTFTNLYSFDFTTGDGPQGGVSMGLDGNFYGTTYQGGAHSAGTVFQITPAGVFKSLYSFTNGTDGAYPKAPPVQAQDGNLYGTTGNGTVAVLYKITTGGVFTVMANLVGQTYAPLLLGTDGNLYGTTFYGGTHNGGSVFQFSPSAKTIKTLFAFHTEWYPAGPLTQGVDGALYGTLSAGGPGDTGAVYRITTGGAYKVLHNFTTAGTTDGKYPYGGVVQGSDNFLYGVASAGGANGLGTLFKISTAGTGFTVLHHFATATGDTPYPALLLHTNGKIYSMTAHGGTHTAYGTFFSFANNLKPFVKPLVLVSANVGASIGLLGQGFSTSTGVLFGNGAGTDTINSDTFLTAKIVAGATTAQITVKEPAGNLLTPLKFNIVPSITSFTPATGPVGTQVVITGMSLSQATGVKFGTVAATVFTVTSNTKITVTVPSRAVTGKVSVATPGGGATSSTAFTVN
jgi:uncharacterized repeat protein (TIGR03803 family)